MSPPNFRLAPCEFSDLAECVDVFNEAFVTDPNFVHFHPRSDPKVTKAHDLKGYEKSFKKPWVKYFKIEDEENGKIAAFGKWEYPHPSAPNGEASLEDFLKTPQPPGSNDDLVIEFFTKIYRGRMKWIVPDKYYFMSILAVRPAYQRKGLGAMLLTPVLQMADRENAKTYIEASTKGKGLYLKHGWVQVDEMVMDLSPYGGAKEEVTTFMMREPSSGGK